MYKTGLEVLLRHITHPMGKLSYNIMQIGHICSYVAVIDCQLREIIYSSLNRCVDLLA